ncbi:hypothetical protein FJY63_06500 [Candidatus Sumerlaeota bacterium]|nr:hypothetical protein [Candidatus Sumerlaeota bacterium]
MNTRAIGVAEFVALTLLAAWVGFVPRALAGENAKDRTEQTEASKSESKTYRQVTWAFDKAKPGPVAAWKVAETAGKGKPAVWEVVADPSAPSQPNALAITANQNTGQTFNLLITENFRFQDLEISVMVKAIAGKEDQGGGPVWRYKDANNYYLARWNPLEENLRAYYVKDGKRAQLGSADVKVDRTKWHRVGVKHVGKKIEVSLDNKKMIEVEDATFAEPGMIGLWVKADGQSAFDDLDVVTQ